MNQLPNIARAVFRKVWLQALIVIALIALRIGAETQDQHQKGFALALKVIQMLWVLAIAWGFNRVITLVRDRGFAEQKLPPGLRSILFLILRMVCFSLAILVALDSVGISVTPLLASLGVGSLAVALALQDTLGNIFSGFYMNLDRPITPGDWIALETGVRGQVNHIGWRTTRLNLGDGNMLIIPNSKLASSVITNFSLEKSELGASLAVAVGYGSDLEKVEEVSLAVAKEVLSNLSGGVLEPAPVVRFQKFTDSSIELVISFRVKNYGDQFLAVHELLKAVKRRYEAEGIEIPYPNRVVHLPGQKRA